LDVRLMHSQKELKIRPYCKMLFSCNKLPESQDDTYAFWRRWAIFDFTRRFTEGKDADAHLEEKLTTPEELSGLLNWALDGLERLLKNNAFTLPSHKQDTQNKWEKSANSFKYFCKNYLVDAEDSIYIGKGDLRKTYAWFCKTEKVKPVTEQKQKQILFDIVPTARDGQIEGAHVFRGVDWNNEGRLLLNRRDGKPEVQFKIEPEPPAPAPVNLPLTQADLFPEDKEPEAKQPNPEPSVHKPNPRSKEDIMKLIKSGFNTRAKLLFEFEKLCENQDGCIRTAEDLLDDLISKGYLIDRQTNGILEVV
jgi:hypothetical protein